MHIKLWREENMGNTAVERGKLIKDFGFTLSLSDGMVNSPGLSLYMRTYEKHGTHPELACHVEHKDHKSCTMK